MIINLGFVMRESQCLDTDSNPIEDLTGNLERECDRIYINLRILRKEIMDNHYF